MSRAKRKSLCNCLESRPLTPALSEVLHELVSSACYSSILYGKPTGIEELKPYIFDAIRQIIRSQEI